MTYGWREKSGDRGYNLQVKRGERSAKTAKVALQPDEKGIVYDISDERVSETQE